MNGADPSEWRNRSTKITRRQDTEGCTPSKLFCPAQLAALEIKNDFPGMQRGQSKKSRNVAQIIRLGIGGKIHAAVEILIAKAQARNDRHFGFDRSGKTSSDGSFLHAIIRV